MAEIELRGYQEESTDNIRAAFLQGIRGVLLVSPTGSGKCLARGTGVLMWDGSTRAVEHIIPGDLLMGPDSQPRQVLTVCSGEDELFQVTPVKGDPYIVNRDHILSLVISGNDPTNCADRSYAPGSIANVSIDEYLGASKTFRHVAKGWRCAVDFPGVLLHQDLPPYMLGIWLGDGTATSFSISKPDEQIKNAVYEYAAILGMAARTDGTTCPTHHVVSPANSLRGRGHRPNRATNALRDVGVLGNKHVPASYLTGTRAQRLELLAGLMDSDGSMNESGGFDFISSIKRLSENVVFIARSLGFSAYMSECQKRDQNGHGGIYWRVYIGGDTHLIPTRIPRKRAKPCLKRKDVLRTGITVKPVGRGPYHGFTLDQDGLFVLADFTVTHNTVTFSHIAKGAAARGNRVLILAHRDFLIKQASQKLSTYGVPHGIIMSGYTPSPFETVQVGSVQTFIKRLRKQRNLYDFPLIIIDEAHLSCAATYLEIIDAFPRSRILGVTGSPCRLDGNGLGTGAGGRFDFMIESVTMRELIDDGYAVQPKVYAPLDFVDLSNVRKKGADYDKEQLAVAVNTQAITGNAIDHWREHAKHVPSATWCVNVQHAADTAREFNAAGIKSVMIYGDSEDDDRTNALKGLADGSIYNVTFCNLLVEGVDVPELGCIIGLRPTHSLAAFLQTLGRASRPLYRPGMPQNTREQRIAAMVASQKGRHSVFLDTTGMTFRHGFQDDIREWDLAGAPKRNGPKEVVDAARQCPVCMAVFPPEPTCPECGYVFAIQPRKLEVREGNLGELTPDMLGKTKHEKRSEVRDARTLEDFQRIGVDRNYSPNWARLQYSMRKAKGEREASDKRQKELWLEEESKTISSNPKFKLDTDWSDI
jgi:superfamily II DNA or RNA helicase